MGLEHLAEALRRYPMAVSVVTVGRGGAHNGLTVSWATPAAFDPPMFLFAVDRLHYSVDFLKSTRNFAVNVLREGQERVAGQFARQSMTGEQKLDGVSTREGTTGAALLADALAWFDCEVAAIHEAGDHLLVLGKVVDAGLGAEGRPMVSTAGLRYQKAGPGR